MKHSYRISAQFVNPALKFDQDAKNAVKVAISVYNSKSLIARNPKQIVDYHFSENNKTLFLSLVSEADLPMPTKALRLLSSYLVEETCLDKYLSGKQLFKMTTSASVVSLITDSTVSEVGDLGIKNDLDRVAKYIRLRQKISPVAKEGLNKVDILIDSLLKGDLD